MQANPPLVRLFSAKHEFPTEWHRFLHPAETEPGHTIKLDLTKELFPFQFRARDIDVNELTVFLKLKDGIQYSDAKPLVFSLTTAGGGPSSQTPPQFEIAGSPVPTVPFAKPTDGSGEIPIEWTLEVAQSNLETLGQPQDTSWWHIVTVDGENQTRLRPDAIEDIWIVCQYSATEAA